MSDKPLCGPWEGGLNRFVPQATFGGACEIHDADYTKPWRPRFHADKDFLVNMVSASGGDSHVLLALVYYAAVRLFGWRYFRGE